MQGDPQTLEIKKKLGAVVKLGQKIINCSNKTSYNNDNSSPWTSSKPMKNGAKMMDWTRVLHN